MSQGGSSSRGSWSGEIRRRLAGLGVAVVAVAPLAIAAWLRPDGEGHGTHTQLGLPACGWVIAFDRPCPTCGMTTAFSHAAEGGLLEAAATQPLGAGLAVLAAAVFWGGLHTAATGCRLDRVVSAALSARTLWVIGAAAVLAWVYKLATW